MFVERKLGDGRSWINIDSDLIAETSQLYQKYDIDLNMHWIKMNVPTWIIIVKMGL